ncbi:glucose-6-phosphate isomerase [Irregularibacter muris]|uniref:glucose-6-phosphate isomerase n=1 Tax=Irregularibacter muris TaxID=1796619 RepID=A0AAE3HEJ9_9FIRM|nr:glucose-6-phosphate isomerase family protein [Irregularibacter muris]MCR1899121.1 glucose-6-phosphate isomerase [Irregularibacter muris]
MKTGFNIQVDLDNLEFIYGDGVFGPKTEKRKLNDIRESLSDPNVSGPEIIYAVAMDVGKEENREDLINRNLLYGAMIFQGGTIGDEPIRSQGHVHAISKSCNCSTPEVYEIWSGEACIYMQEYATDNPGRCFAVHAQAGQIVIVPPGWAHCTINDSIDEPMLFGAWCIRDYGFEYKDIRAHNGIAFYPKVRNEKILFEQNSKYTDTILEIKEARDYPEFKLKQGIPIYTQYEKNHNLFSFVTQPQLFRDIWKGFCP